MTRILLFLGVNMGVILIASITLSLLGVEPYLQQNGLNLRSLLIFSAVFGMSGAFVSLFLSKWMAKKTMHVRVITNPSNRVEQKLYDMTAELARQTNIGMPEVGIFPAAQSNAFATGWNRNHALIAVSEGMLKNFHDRELRAVLAHEVGHVANGDMVTMTLIQGVINTFVIFFARIIGYAVDKLVFKNRDGVGIGFYMASIAAEVLLGILASIIVMAYSRWREYRADAFAARMTEKSAMVGALQALQREYKLPDAMSDSLVGFGITRGNRHGLRALFASHPPLQARIAALENLEKSK